MSNRRKIIKENRELDPFSYMADRIAVNTEDDVWEEEPVSFREFVESPDFLDLKFDPETGRGCRPKIMEYGEAIVADNVREAILLLGKGSGKGFISSIIHAYGIYECLCLRDPQKYYGLAPGSALYFVNTARNEKQAKKVFFKEFTAKIKGCPWFDGKYDEPGVDTISFIKNVEALSANSQAYGWLGYNTIRWIGDELAFFLVDDKNEMSESRAEECWEAAYGSCQTRFPEHYKMVGITTPRDEGDFVMTKVEELKERMKEDKDTFFAQAATWDIHPKLTKDDFKHAFKRNYRRAMRDFGAVPTGVIDSFWGESEFFVDNVCDVCKKCIIYKERKESTDIYACYSNMNCKANPYVGNGKFREWFFPLIDMEYHIHFDLSISGDRVGFTLGHSSGTKQVQIDKYELEVMKEKKKIKVRDDCYYIERPIIIIDAVGFISPHSGQDPLLIRNGEIYYDGILNHIIYQLKDRGFNIVGVTFDRFQSHHIKQTLEEKDYEVDLVSCDRTDEVPVQAKLAVIENRVLYPYSKLLCKEAVNLQYVGKKVDHPKNGSKDVWDSFASVIYKCEDSSFVSGPFVGL